MYYLNLRVRLLAQRANKTERVERGLFDASDETRYNVNVNSAVNMARRSICKSNSDLFESEEGVVRAVDALQRITLSNIESGQNLKETSLEAPPSRTVSYLQIESLLRSVNRLKSRYLQI